MPFRMNGVEMSSVIVNGVSMDNVYVNGVLVFTAGWDLTGASYDGVFKLINPPVATPSELFFKPDGLKMYATDTGIGGPTDYVHQFTLGTAWNAGTIVSDNVSLLVSGQTPGPTGLAFDSTGTKVFITGSDTGFTNQFIFQYNLGTAWNLATGSYSGISKVLTPSASAKGVAFKSDGLRFYIADSAGDRIYQYNLGTAWNISTANYSGLSFSVATQEASVQSVQFSTTGTQMYIIGNGNNTVYEYQLNTAWDISTVVATPSASYTPGQGETFSAGISFKTDGSKMYITGLFKDSVYQYTV